MMRENSRSHLSQRLHAELGQLIAETAPGERLPSEPALAKELGVSRATLREAMRTFETQGLIHRRQGVGTFVIHPQQVIESGMEVLQSIETLADRIGLEVNMGAFKVVRREATAEEQGTLKLGEGGIVLQISRVIEAEGRPVAFLEDVLPEGMLSPEELRRDFTGSVLDLLLRRGEPALTNARTEISAAAAEAEVARSLGIQRGDVVLYFRGTLYSADGRVVDASLSYFLPGYFRFHVVRSVGK